jgi:hypothetical protein
MMTCIVLYACESSQDVPHFPQKKSPLINKQAKELPEKGELPRKQCLK